MTERQYELYLQRAEYQKRQIFYINEWKNALEDYHLYVALRMLEEPAQLRHCKACVYETDTWYLLKSYNTLVAAIRKTTGDCFDALRYVYGYTSTSAQHIAKFRNDYGCKTYCRIDAQ